MTRVQDVFEGGDAREQQNTMRTLTKVLAAGMLAALSAGFVGVKSLEAG